jgi:hypothetical protein
MKAEVKELYNSICQEDVFTLYLILINLINFVLSMRFGKIMLQLNVLQFNTKKVNFRQSSTKNYAEQRSNATRAGL